MKDDTAQLVALIVACSLLALFLGFSLGVNYEHDKHERGQNFLRGDTVSGGDSVVWPELDEEIQVPDGVVTNIVLKVRLYDSASRMESDAGIGRVDGASWCARDVEANKAWCDIFIMRPRYVDGYNSWTLGHEVLHGVYGPEYHE